MTEGIIAMLLIVCALALIYCYIIDMNARKYRKSAQDLSFFFVKMAAERAAERIGLCEVESVESVPYGSDEGCITVLWKFYDRAAVYKFHSIVLPVNSVMFHASVSAKDLEEVMYKDLVAKRKEARAQWESVVKRVNDHMENEIDKALIYGDSQKFEDGKTHSEHWRRGEVDVAYPLKERWFEPILRERPIERFSMEFRPFPSDYNGTIFHEGSEGKRQLEDIERADFMRQFREQLHSGDFVLSQETD